MRAATEPRGLEITHTTDQLAQFLYEGREGIMFQMIDESKVATPEDKKLFWYKVGLFFVVAAAFGGVIYFFAFVPYSG